MKTGQSTTSFHPATGNPIMTSTTYNRSAAYAMDESKTAPFNESLGEMHDSNRGVHKGWGTRTLRAINDLLPLSIRPIKSKRASRRRYLGVRHRIFIARMHWRSHNKNKVMKCLGLKKSQ
jgi:hypothetical protein